MPIPHVLEEAEKSIDEREVAEMETPEVYRVIGIEVALIPEFFKGRSDFGGTLCLYIDPESFNTLIVCRGSLNE